MVSRDGIRAAWLGSHSGHVRLHNPPPPPFGPHIPRPVVSPPPPRDVRLLRASFLTCGSSQRCAPRACAKLQRRSSARKATSVAGPRLDACMLLLWRHVGRASNVAFSSGQGHRFSLGPRTDGISASPCHPSSRRALPGTLHFHFALSFSLSPFSIAVGRKSLDFTLATSLIFPVSFYRHYAVN